MDVEVSAQPGAGRRRFGGLQGSHALVVLFIVALFNYVDRSLISVLQVPIKRELGLSDAQLGALTGLSFALFYAGAALPLGRLVDRWRRTLLMAAAIAVWTTMTALSGLATGFAMLLLLRIGVALGEAVSVPATHSLLSDYFERRHRGSAFAAWAVAPSLGVMLGVFAGGWLTADIGWRNSFIAVGVTGFFVVPLLFLLREPPRGQFDGGVASDARTPSWRESVAALWRLRSFRYLVAAATLHTFSQQALLNWLPPFYARVHSMPLAEVGIWAALIIGVGGGLGAMFGGVLLDRLIRHDTRWYGWYPAAAVLLMVPLALGQLFALDRSVSLALGFGTLFCGMLYTVPVNVTAQSMVSPLMRGVTSAILMLIPTILGLGLGPFLTGWTSDLFAQRMGMEDTSLRYALALALAGSLASGLLFLKMAGGLKRDLPPTPTTGD